MSDLICNRALLQISINNDDEEESDYDKEQEDIQNDDYEDIDEDELLDLLEEAKHFGRTYRVPPNVSLN